MPRIVAVEARGRGFSFDLEPGLPLLEAVRTGFAAEGFSSGVVEFGQLALAPIAYVTPALSKTPANAAFYSEIFRPAGITRVECGAMTFGLRDGASFFHCHALWREADGHASGGHILPEETIVAGPARVTALGLDGACFEAEPDPEINFKVFGPITMPRSTKTAGSRIIALRLRPNQDFSQTIEHVCRTYNIAYARLRGGVGSTIGARLENGIIIDNFATEVFIQHGRIAPGADGMPIAKIDVGVVDYTGQRAEGTLVRGDNPVLMTFELVIEEMLGP